MYSALIAEDESALVDFLKTELNILWPELKVIGVAYNGSEALRLIDALSPSIAFLDIRMPGLTGLEVAAKLQDSHAAPRIVFVTAFDQYAVDAFESEAVDYLLKPPTRERLSKTIAKLKNQLNSTKESLPTSELLAKLSAMLKRPAQQSGLDWIRAAHGNETRLISVAEVIYFESNDKYVSVFTKDGEFLIRTPLRELIDGLDPSHFWQVHRGTVVAVKQIAGITRDFRGRTLLKLKERKEELVVSRAYVHLFKQM